MAGKRLREIMEKHHMRATSAEQGVRRGLEMGGEEVSTLMGCVWAPEALPVRCSGPLRRLAQEIQLINTRKLKDH